MGVEGVDSIFYIRVTLEWLKGNFVFTYPGNESFFRPVLFSYFTLAYKFFGVHPWSIKLLNLLTEVALVLLWFKVARHYFKSVNLSLFFSTLCLWTLYTVPQTKQELAHIPSMFFVTLSFYLLLKHTHRKNYLLLALSGFTLSLSTGCHPDLALIAPGFVFFNALVKEKPFSKAHLTQSFIESVIFSLSFFALFGIYFIIWSPSEVVEMLRSNAKYAKVVPGKHFPMLFFEFITEGVKKLVGATFMQLYYFAIGFNIYLIIRKKVVPKVLTILLPLFSYWLLFELLITRNVMSPLVRLQMPLIFLIYLFVLKSLFPNPHGPRFKLKCNVLIGLLTLAVIYPYWTYRDRGPSFSYYGKYLNLPFYKYQTMNQWVHNKLGKQVRPDSKVLFYPQSIFHTYETFNLPFYFSGNAVHTNECQGRAEDFINFIKSEKVKWVYVAKSHLLRGNEIRHRTSGYCSYFESFEMEYDFIKNQANKYQFKQVENDDFFGQIYQVQPSFE